ncbi:cell division protein FtsQ/DivIB [Brevibacillus dissolubilis]|uniref:cell division protein FtsQ/DivIB n=1 Tax=Brevibacillus dissolubilis TaxID=1844116 RepID=UPI0011167472|nr:FtsQ-type POTRA domain-containing protein [Brevibacillus dissolubilis]
MSVDERIPQVKQVQPKKRGNKKLLSLILLFFLTVLGIVFFRSPYSKVSEIQIYGNQIYSKEEILQASGLYEGMQFLNIWDNSIRENLAVLPGIERAQVTRDFPGIVRLEIKEYQRVAYVAKSTGEMQPLLEDGKLLTLPKNRQIVVDRPIIRNWSSKEQLNLATLAHALGELPPTMLSQISDLSLNPSAFDKERVILYMRDGNEVESTVHLLKDKLPWYPSIAKEIPKGQKGVIHLFESSWFSTYEAERAERASQAAQNAAEAQQFGQSTETRSDVAESDGQGTPQGTDPPSANTQEAADGQEAITPSDGQAQSQSSSETPATPAASEQNEQGNSSDTSPEAQTESTSNANAPSFE